MTSDLAIPLAARMRPKKLEDFSGQQHLLGSGRPLQRLLETGNLPSIIFWGPPGVGKTTLARLLAAKVGARFYTISAVLAGVKDVRDIVNKVGNQKTVLFVDEIHRFNKSQQDAFLPYVEDGTIILFGATTMNPSFQLNNALLSRSRVFVLKSLLSDDLEKIIKRALAANPDLASCSAAAINKIATLADGDARRALNALEMCSDSISSGSEISTELVTSMLQDQPRLFDNAGDQFYDIISALHKSVRGSDPDAALYWLARLLDGGCDPAYVARRIVRIASEDIGNADPRALDMAISAWQAYERLGKPEGELALAQAVSFLALCAKSNACYTSWNDVQRVVRETGSLDVPLKLRNAPTELMRDLNYKKGYKYAHDFPDGIVWGEHYMPDELQGKQYYNPKDRGLEIKLKEKLDLIRKQQEAE